MKHQIGCCGISKSIIEQFKQACDGSGIENGKQRIKEIGEELRG